MRILAIDPGTTQSGLIDTLMDRLDGNSVPEPNTGCKLWLGTTTRGGYGRLTVFGHPVAAHRAAYEVHIGVIPVGMGVLHRCDVACCIEPTHLFLGTNGDNNRDRHRKGRDATGDRNGSRTHPECRMRGDSHPSRLHPQCLARGRNNGNSKLTDDDVRLIRRRCADGESHQRVADSMGVSQPLVSCIIRREIWRHVD